MRVLLVLLFAVAAAYPQDLYLSCSAHSRQDAEAFVADLAKENTLWTCGIYNSGEQERVVSQAEVLMGLHALGVKGVRAAVVKRSYLRKRYKGFLYTTARIVETGNDVVIFGVATDLIKPNPVTLALLGVGKVILPLIPNALRARAPQEADMDMIAMDAPLGIKPKSGIEVSIWAAGNAPAGGIVRGYLEHLVSPPIPQQPSIVGGRAWGTAQQPLENLRISWPTHYRCAHVVPADCVGRRCMGWWSDTWHSTERSTQ